MVKYRTEVRVDVPAEDAWRVLSDLPAWPEWTPTVESLECDGRRPRPGMPVRIKQPGRRTVEYVVDVADEKGGRFRWGSKRAGITQWADHVVTPTGPSSCTVALTFVMSGPIGSVLGALGRSTIETMVDTEAESLRAVLAGREGLSG